LPGNPGRSVVRGRIKYLRPKKLNPWSSPA
jgi:hypothetical protein